MASFCICPRDLLAKLAGIFVFFRQLLDEFFNHPPRLTEKIAIIFSMLDGRIKIFLGQTIYTFYTYFPLQQINNFPPYD